MFSTVGWLWYLIVFIPEDRFVSGLVDRGGEPIIKIGAQSAEAVIWKKPIWSRSTDFMKFPTQGKLPSLDLS